MSEDVRESCRKLRTPYSANRPFRCPEKNDIINLPPRAAPAEDDGAVAEIRPNKNAKVTHLPPSAQLLLAQVKLDGFLTCELSGISPAQVQHNTGDSLWSRVSY